MMKDEIDQSSNFKDDQLTLSSKIGAENVEFPNTIFK
jgi:hypothetical protein